MNKLLKSLIFLAFFVVGCETANPLEPNNQENMPEEMGLMVPLLKGKPLPTTGCSAEGQFVGFNESTDNPTYGIYEYTLWAGKHIEAGTVTITNDESNLYVTYKTDGTSQLEEVHIYVWEEEPQLSQRPAPGQAPYSAQNIGQTEYTITIPLTELVDCGKEYFISAHAALSNGETAYGGNANSPACFDSQKGAWWSYMNYTVDCFYDIEVVVTGECFEDYTVTITGGEFENLIPGEYTITVTAPNSEEITLTQVISLVDQDEIVEFVFSCPITNYDPCDTNQDGIVDEAELEACTNNPGSEVGTAYMFGNTPFCDIQPRWGWANYVTEGDIIIENIYAGAAQCDTTKGTLVGTAIINGSAGTVTITMFDNYYMNDLHMNVSPTFPEYIDKFGNLSTNINSNGNFNSNPLSWGPQYQELTFDVENGIYIIIHMSVWEY